MKDIKQIISKYHLPLYAIPHFISHKFPQHKLLINLMNFQNPLSLLAQLTKPSPHTHLHSSPKIPTASAHSNKAQLALSHETSSVFTAEQQILRFSRFEPWHLPEMAHNLQSKRNQTPILDHYSSIDDDSLLCPNASYGIFDHKDFVNSNMKTIHTSTVSNNGDNFQNTQSSAKSKAKEKGLRKLANRSYLIVKQMGQSNYKQVAMRLIKQMQEDESEVDDEKQENNIKRRVYDALNVLIAMGVLHKRGKSIVYEQDIAKDAAILKMESTFKNMESINNKQEQNRKKKQTIKDLQERLKAGKALVVRNSLKAQNENPNERIYFPFDCLLVDRTSESKFEEKEGTKSFIMSTNGHYQIFKDLELVAKIFS